MISLLAEDLRHKAEWYGLPPSKRSLLRMWVSDGTTAQVLYRMMQYCQSHRLRPIAAILYRLNASISHAIIGRNAQFGPGLVILHSIGVVINSSVRAGSNLVIEHGVTIGAEKDRSPALGDNIYIGAGAKILGAVTIGSNVKIGANAVVTHDIPDNATAVGIPARIIRLHGKPVDSGVDVLQLLGTRT